MSKDDYLHIRIDKEKKELFKKAANIQGFDKLTQWAIPVLFKEAQRVVKEKKEID